MVSALSRPAIIVLTDGAAELAARLGALLDGDVHAPHGRGGENGAADAIAVRFDDAIAHMQALFRKRAPIVGVCASGILIRALAPLLSDKWAEPPVLAVAEDGSSVVPLLGGHHGANGMAREIATALKGHAAITTAGDLRLGVALDAPPARYRLANPQDVKGVARRLIDGAPVAIYGDTPFIAPLMDRHDSEADIEIHTTTSALDHSGDRLVYHPQSVLVGVGCERGVSGEVIEAHVRDCLRRAEVSPHAVAALVSLDIKADEAGLHAAARALGVEARFFTRQEIMAHAMAIPTPSRVVLDEVGVPGVAEGAVLAAIKASGFHGGFLLEKVVGERVTCAIGRVSHPPDVASLGRARGRLSVVGLGPGDPVWRSPAVTEALMRADHWVGYHLYLDLAGDLHTHQERHDFPLGGEEARVRFALEKAGEGADVALVCSGDAGIYAMAALVHEVLDPNHGGAPLSEAARRAEIVIEPGISAFQAAAARSGAMIGHDFCCISLSDLLTPWEHIVGRVRAAAEGDFVVAFYNPRSEKRQHQLAEAMAVLAAHRPETTPVVLASHLGRPDERVETVPLHAFDPEEVDMMTVVLVGSSTSRAYRRGDGATPVYTPRGYAKKWSVQA